MAETTVTVAVVSGTLALLAWITVVPAATPVTGTATVVLPCAIVAVGCTVAVAGVAEVTLNVTPPAGAGAANVRVRFWVAVPLMVRELGVNDAEVFTVTLPVAPVRPEAEAVMVVEPRPVPVICGCVVGAVAPCAIETLVVDRLTLDPSAIARVMVVAEAAGAARVTAWSV